MAHAHQVVIVGGGLGGLTAALALRQRGVDVVVLEQAAELGEIGAGIQTAPNASRILIRLGLRKKLEAIRTEPQDQVRRRWRDGSIIASKPLGLAVQEAYGAPYWHYHRADLHRALLDGCLDPSGAGPAVRFEVNSCVTHIDTSDELRPSAVTAAGHRHTADVLVGADGINSAVRHLMGAPDTLMFAGEMAYRALIPGKSLLDDPATRFLFDRFHSTIWYGPDRHLVHYVIRRGQYLNVVAIVPATSPEDRTRRGPVSVEELASSFPDWDDRVPAILSKAEDNVTIWPMHHMRPDPRWINGRVVLLGDACHAMLPYQAQGASQAMEDAAVLAEEVGNVTKDGIDGALVRYGNRRAIHAGLVQSASFENKRLYHLPDGEEQEARDAKLRSFEGESELSYDWLWRGTPLTDREGEGFHYAFPR